MKKLLAGALALALMAGPALAQTGWADTDPNNPTVRIPREASVAHPLPTQGVYGASNLAAVTGTFTATGQSSSFTPVAGRPFNVTARGTFVGTVQLERSFDGTNWHPITAAGSQLYVWTVPFSEIAVEPQYGVLYRLDCTSYTSGTVNFRISQ